MSMLVKLDLLKNLFICNSVYFWPVNQSSAIICLSKTRSTTKKCKSENLWNASKIYVSSFQPKLWKICTFKRLQYSIEWKNMFGMCWLLHVIQNMLKLVAVFFLKLSKKVKFFIVFREGLSTCWPFFLSLKFG
jgi:hypothetical protein